MHDDNNNDDDTNSLSLSTMRERSPMKRRNNRSAGLPQSCLYLFLMLAASLFLGSTVTTAYRMGDAVDTDIRLASGTSDALRSQMPQFGISSKANFRFEDQQDSFRCSLKTACGPPWYRSSNSKGRSSGKLIVTFVYSNRAVVRYIQS
jgi:hypothetical protein